MIDLQLLSSVPIGMANEAQSFGIDETLVVILDVCSVKVRVPLTLLDGLDFASSSFRCRMECVTKVTE